MAQVMEREVRNLFPLIRCGSLFERSKPMMNARFCELLVALRSKKIRTFWIASTMLKILEERSPGLIEQINLTKFASLMSNVDLPDFRPNMGMFYKEMSYVTHPASSPIAESKKRFSSQILCLFDQHA